MKKLLTIGFAALLAGCATTATCEKSAEAKADAKSAAVAAKPAEKKYVDPNPFSDYGPGMKHTKEIPLGSYWQQDNKAKIAEATKVETLAAFVATPAAADALLAKVGPAYTTDPVVLTQIGAVTQLVMCPKCDKAPASRKVWVAALERALKNAKDDYRKAFYADQLRWCGFKK